MKLALNLSFLAALVTAACGCAGPTGPDVEFPAEGTVRAPQRVAEVQRRKAHAPTETSIPSTSRTTRSTRSAAPSSTR
jgi:hypothetical protein